MISRRFAVVAIVSAFLPLQSMGQTSKEPTAPMHEIVRSGDLHWTAIMKGCELASISGDLNVEEPFVLRIRCADGTKIPAHWHPTDENLTVLEGVFLVATGEKFDETKLRPMDVGSYAMMPREMRHFALCKGETVVQVHGLGPFKVNWVNPAEVLPPDAPTGEAAKAKF